MPDEALRAGNTAPCYTKAVFRQAASELRGQCKLDDDMIKELRSQRKNLLASDPVDTLGVGGYIQVIGDLHSTLLFICGNRWKCTCGLANVKRDAFFTLTQWERL